MGEAMSDVNAVMALKNAWNGAVAASARVGELAASVQSLPEDAPVASLDLEAYQRVTLAQANAVMALRGLIEQLQRKTAAG
jgi:hypothetical protein